MTILSHKSLLALEAVCDVAVNARPDPVQARAICARLGVPQRYLEQIMQVLVRANILRGVRGPQGGYRLARERRRIKILEIINIIDKENYNAKNDTKTKLPHSAIGKKLLSPLSLRIDAAVDRALTEEIGAMTLDELCLPLLDSKTEKENASDFNI